MVVSNLASPRTANGFSVEAAGADGHMAMGKSLRDDPSFCHLLELTRWSMSKSMVVVQEFRGMASMRESIFFIHDNVRPVRSIKTEDYFSTGVKVTSWESVGGRSSLASSEP